jgi:putative membrane protein
MVCFFPTLIVNRDKKFLFAMPYIYGMHFILYSLNMMMKKVAPVLLIALMGVVYACNDTGNDAASDNKGADTVNRGAATEAVPSITNTARDTGATATAPTSPPLDKEGTAFALEAASGGKTEVELGRLAQQQAVNPRVKEFGAMMVRDHSKANDELKQLAGAKQIALPVTLTSKHQHHKDEISKKTGAAFDKAYMNMMVNEHQETISKFEKISKSSNDGDLRGFAIKTLPVLTIHLDSAKAINKSLK